jgi:hypothetical protein
MNSSLHADSMQQIRHTIFEQNLFLMKILGGGMTRNVAHHDCACLPSKALFPKGMRVTESVHKLRSMVDKNYYLQHVGLVTLRQRRKLYWHLSLHIIITGSRAMSQAGCSFLIFLRLDHDFHQMSNCAVRDCSLWKRMM